MGNLVTLTAATGHSLSGSSSVPWLQRKCACGECETCRKKRAQLRGNGHESGAVPPIVREVLRSPGEPLDAATRGFFETRFGHDFSRVRIHADTTAAQSSQTIDASAYTAGADIVFAADRYAPRTEGGMRLLAHELAHVVQQSASSTSPAAAIAPADHPLEREADAAADRIASGTDALLPSIGGAVGLQRQPASGGAPQADDCSGWEADPVSFSIHVARHVASTQIDPKLANDGQMPVCEAPRSGRPHSTDCEVPFKDGPPILVMWNPAARRALARFDVGGERKRFLFSYSCPGGQLTLSLILTRTDPATGSGTGGANAP